jgi:hypothetical protein
MYRLTRTNPLRERSKGLLTMSALKFALNQTGAGFHRDTRREVRAARPTDRRRALQESLALLEDVETTLWGGDVDQPAYVVLSDGRCVAEEEL